MTQKGRSSGPFLFGTDSVGQTVSFWLLRFLCGLLFTLCRACASMTKRLPRAVLIARRGATTTVDTERGALYPVGRSRGLGVTLARLLACLDFVRWRFWGVGPESSIESCHFFSPSQAAQCCRSVACGEAEGAAERDSVVGTSDGDLVGSVGGQWRVRGHIALMGLEEGVRIVDAGD